MTGTCPKCHANIELEVSHSDVTEAGTTASCPACKAHLTLFKESFGGRALRKSDEVSCSHCGGQLGAELHCQSCGVPFPDYLVTALGKKVQKKASRG